MSFFNNYDEDLDGLDGLQEESKPPSKATDIDDLMSEAERRFAKAQYYRALLTEPIFDESTPMASDVVAEIKEFVRTRLSVLLGVTQEAPKAIDVFSEEEVTVLKQVAARLTAKPALANTPPSVKTAKAPIKPSVKKASAPETARKTPEPAPQQPQQSQVAQIVIDGVKYTKTDKKKGGVWVNEHGGRFVVATNNKGEKYMKSVTTQTIPKTGRAPPPNEAQMFALASANVAAATKNDKLASSISTLITGNQ